MRPISRALFLDKWGSRLSQEQKEAIPQKASFFDCKGGGFVLLFRRRICRIVMASGRGLDMFRDLIATLKANGYSALVFAFRDNSPTSGLVRYAKGRRWVSRETYDDGSPVNLAMVRLNTARLRHGRP